MEKLLPPTENVLDAPGPASPQSGSSVDSGSAVTNAMEQLTTDTKDKMEVEHSTSQETAAKPTPQLQQQIKQIKPLLSGSSRLGRALAELFGLLVKLCVGSPLRQRRGQQIPPSPAMPSPPARAVATALTKLLASGLLWEPPATSPIPKFRLTFFICSVGFTSPMLFDEKKYPYHLMLMKFITSGGQQAFFQTFNWAITLGNTVQPECGLEHPDIPDGTGEFLDAWLMLLEKMVNPKTLMESPHVLPNKPSGNFKPFDSLQYLIKTHKLAFEAVMCVWGRKPLPVYGGRMSESVLAILCHILKGEKLIQERLDKERREAEAAKPVAPAAADSSTAPAPAAAEPASSTPAEPDVNPEHLQTLMDMGFPRERCVEAMQAVGGSLDAATDYLLNNPLPPLQQSLTGNFGPGIEQDELMRAIAMSLGENVIVSTDGQEGAPSGGATAAPVEKKEEEEEDISREDQESLKQAVIDDFTDTALNGCLTLLDTLPDTVYRVTDLLMAIFQRNGADFKEKLLKQLMDEVKQSVQDLLEVAHNSTGNVTSELVSCSAASRAAVRIHLFTLLFEDCNRLCVRLVEEACVVELMVRLVSAAQEALAVSQLPGTHVTPKWVTPMLLFIDLYEKVVLGMKRRAAMAEVASHNWKWFDISSGKWCAYTGVNNKTIDDAYWAGEASVKVTTGRRRYNIQFGAMVQANEETGNRRPIMISLKEKPKGEEKKSDEKSGTGSKSPMEDDAKKKTEDESKEDSKIDTEDDLKEKEKVEEPEAMEVTNGQAASPKAEVKDEKDTKTIIYKCTGLTDEQSRALLRAAVGLIAVPVEPDALNAILRLCLRLTRNFEHAAMFAELGGIKLLLGLTLASGFSGFSSLASLLVRHVLEDGSTLRHTLEKVIRSSTATSSAATTKELHYLLRVLAPAACRDPALFAEVTAATLRVDLSLLNKRGEPEDDLRLLVKSLPAKSATAPPLKDVSKNVISDLLNFLVQCEPEEVSCETKTDDDTTTSSNTDNGELPTSVASILSQGAANQGISNRPQMILRQNSASGELQMVNNMDLPKPAAGEQSKQDKDADDARRKRPLLPKSAVCRLLAEMVKSYAGCARLITEHVFTAGMSDLVKEECSALAFILDELLTSTADKDCAGLVKMLVAALASCNHAPDAQTSLVTEVKNALTRALSLQECSIKHSKIQALAGLVSTMIESCPASTVSPNLPPFKPSPVNMNNIVKCMVKRGVITDLARVPHALDLSSPSMAATVNAALKPLETLSRIVNQPTGLPQGGGSKKTKATERPEPETAGVGTNTTNSEATRAQGDDVTEADAELATEHDVSTAAESLDPNSESHLHTVEETPDDDFEEMMDQLMERDLPPDQRVAICPPVDRHVHMDTDDGMINDSQGEQQSLLEVDEEERVEDDDSDTDSSHSQAETEGSGAEEEMEGEEDEDDGEDDDEDDDDDDAGSDVYEDDQEEFDGLEDAFFRMPPNAGEGQRENILMIGNMDHDPIVDEGAVHLPLWGDVNTDGLSAADNLAGGVGSAAGPSHVTPTHPLLMGRGTADAPPAAVARGQGRTLQRSRGFRYIALPRNGGNGGNGPNGPGVPAILQSLLGHNSIRDFLQLSGTGGANLTQNRLQDARVLVMDSGFAILDSLGDGIPGLESGGLLGTTGGSALSTVPSALVRWSEESRVLDGDSAHDCVTVLKPALLSVVDAAREEELTERREKRKKQTEEEEAKRKKDEDERKSKEPEIAAAAETTPAAESAANDAGEMDVVVSENAGLQDAVNTAVAEATGSVGSASRSMAAQLADGLAGLGAVISTGVRVHIPSNPSTQPISTTVADTSSGTQPQFSLSNVGILSSLSEYLPGQPGILHPPGNSQATPLMDIPPGPLSTVLQTLNSRTDNTQAGPNGASTPVEPSNPESLQPSFLFSTPPPPFPTLPVAASVPTSEDPTPATLPAALAPLSPSPDQESQPAENVEAQDVSMNSEPEVDVENTPETIASIPLPVAPATSEAQGATAAPPAIPEPDFSAILGDIEIPEGVDPSFLAALPEDMRQEVIEEQRRLARLRQQPAPAAREAAGSQSLAEVNPEFLAALPPNIQEEVLAQQRLEQQRQNQAAADPTAPVDPGEFLQTLPPSLRQSVLADMEDSQMATLPPDLAAEAASLRRDYEQRNRALMHERFFNHVNHSGTALSSILRNTVSRLGSHYAIHSGSGGPGRNVWRSIGRGGPGHQHGASLLAAANNVKFRGRQLLDHEGLSCLLILLFIDDAKLNTTRLHRILRNLCYHAPTRDWVIKCLLSILEKANDGREFTTTNPAFENPAGTDATATPTPPKMRRSTSKTGEASAATPAVARGNSNQTSWLNISLDAALGFRAGVFQVQRQNSVGGKKSGGSGSSSISVHPQAAPVVCRHTLEVLISLAKSFPIHFLPGSANASKEASDKEASDTKTPGKSGIKDKSVDFWDTLLKLDRECWSSRKGKSVVRSHSSVSMKEEEEMSNTTLGVSAFGQLLGMLSCPVLRRSSLLTDKLLRLLSLISLGQPDVIKKAAEDYKLDSEPGTSSESANEEPVKEEQISLAVEVLTSKACSEEGLEDVTALLLNLSYGGAQTRETILRLLLAGARELGNVVQSHVSALLKELAELKASGGLSAVKEDEEEGKQKGTLSDRFTKEAVVLVAPTKLKGGGELQLSSMTALTNKTSSQSFFLRVLKVIIQLREAALLAIKSNKSKQAEAAKQAESTTAPGTSTTTATSEDDPAEAAPDTNTESATEPPVMASTDEPVAPTVSATPMDVGSPTNMNNQASTLPQDLPMEVESPAPPSPETLESLSSQLALDELWNTLSACLQELVDTPDHHAVLVLQPTVEAFFLVHAAVTSSDEKKKSTQKETRQEQLAHIQENPSLTDIQVNGAKPDLTRETSVVAAKRAEAELSPDTKQFLQFAETHRTVLNQILRQSTAHLADGPFAVLVDHTRVLDFDIKRRYFRTELERMDEGIRRGDLAVHVRRDAVFEESFRELHRRSAEEWKNRFYIVFEGEEGQDAGGLLREWYVIISREIFNPNYALYKASPGDRVTYTINDSSHINSNHLCYFKFVGRVIAKAIYDNKLLECYFTRSFYKHILAKPVRHQDMESEDYAFFKGLDFLAENNVEDLGSDLTFSTEIQEFGVTETRELIPNGKNIAVTDENKFEYIRLVCQMKMTGAIRKQLAAFLEGFYDIIPRRLISIFNEQELELLLSGLPDINIDDLKANTEYHKYTTTSLQIVWFWRALRSCDQTDRAKFLQFVTGSSKVPLQGFAALEGMNGAQKFQIHRDDRSTDRLPSAHTCFNQLDLPAYETYDKLRTYLLKAIRECSEGFGFA